jgi:hypothetical protein
MTKYFTLALSVLLLPVMLFAIEKTVRVGDKKARIKVEQKTLQMEMIPAEPPPDNVEIIPLDKYPDHEMEIPTIYEIEAINPEDVETVEDGEGAWKWTLTSRVGADFVEILAGSRWTGEFLHFMDLWFNYRYNRLVMGDISNGEMLQNYNYTEVVEPLTYGVYFKWSGFTNYMHRASSGHAGYSYEEPDHPIRYATSKKQMNVFHPQNMVGLY